VSVSPENKDRLLWRLRRSLIEARNIDINNAEDHRRALVLSAEIQKHIQQLTDRLASIENEMRSAAHRVGAMNAYQKVAGRAGSLARGRGKGVN